MQMIGQHVMHDLRQTLFSHLQRLDVQFFDKNPVGRLMTRVMGDVQVLNELFASGVITVFANLLQILGIMVAMLLYNWKLALVTFTVIPIIFGATLVYQIYSRRCVSGTTEAARPDQCLFAGKHRRYDDDEAFCTRAAEPSPF